MTLKTESDFTLHEPLEELLRSRPGQVRLSSLVLSAVGIPHQLASKGRVLLVHPRDRDRALAQLQAFAEENRGWPPRRPVAPAASSRPPTVLLMGLLALFYSITGPWEQESRWFLQGAVDSHRILAADEWYRLFTGLTLHADPVHLLGNCLIGGFMVHLLCQTTGTGLGWLLILLGGGLGNLINLLVRDTPHLSVGFSTAIFAAIGMFSGLRLGHHQAARQMLLPLGAGASLLALLGTAGEHTDLGAHLFGFLGGILLGWLVQRAGLLTLAKDQRLQLACFFLALGLLGVCWWLALATA